MMSKMDGIPPVDLAKGLTVVYCTLMRQYN